VYKLYDEDGMYMRVVKRKEEAEYFVQYYNWKAKFFRETKQKDALKEVLKNLPESPL